jgi:hypothetical protein
MKTGIVNNTNYNIASKTAFTASLNVHEVEGMIGVGHKVIVQKAEEMIGAEGVEILKGIASRIGKETDSINVNVGPQECWFEGDTGVSV